MYFTKNKLQVVVLSISFRSDAVSKFHIGLAGPWCAAYGSIEIVVGMFVRITLRANTAALLHIDIAHHVLSCFPLPAQMIINENQFTSLGWIDGAICMPECISIYILQQDAMLITSRDGQAYMHAHVCLAWINRS